MTTETELPTDMSEKLKALEAARLQIEKQFGRVTVPRSIFRTRTAVVVRNGNLNPQCIRSHLRAEGVKGSPGSRPGTHQLSCKRRKRNGKIMRLIRIIENRLPLHRLFTGFKTEDMFPVQRNFRALRSGKIIRTDYGGYFLRSKVDDLDAEENSAVFRNLPGAGDFHGTGDIQRCPLHESRGIFRTEDNRELRQNELAVRRFFHRVQIHVKQLVIPLRQGQ